MPQVTAITHRDGLNMAVGSSTGKVVLYDLRSSKPLLVKDLELVYVAFDVLYDTDHSVIDRPLRERHRILRRMFKDIPEDTSYQSRGNDDDSDGEGSGPVAADGSSRWVPREAASPRTIGCGAGFSSTSRRWTARLKTTIARSGPRGTTSSAR